MVSESLGRITAEPVTARLSSPFYHSSAMDGYAVKYQETFGASETSPKKLKLGEQAVYIDTGDPMPDGFNAVIMIEDVNIVRCQVSGVRSQDSGTKLRTNRDYRACNSMAECKGDWRGYCCHRAYTS